MNTWITLHWKSTTDAIRCIVKLAKYHRLLSQSHGVDQEGLQNIRPQRQKKNRSASRAVRKAAKTRRRSNARLWRLTCPHSPSVSPVVQREAGTKRRSNWKRGLRHRREVEAVRRAAKTKRRSNVKLWRLAGPGVLNTNLPVQGTAGIWRCREERQLWCRESGRACPKGKMNRRIGKP